MAGNKKKKKPAANPARGFATTSIASKPRPEVSDSEAKPLADGVSGASAPPSKENAPPSAKSTTGDGHGNIAARQNSEDKPLSPEEFERQLEESELQLLVEKHSQKIKRDAQRQRTRLETDRRLLRSQADLVNAPKWLPPDLVEHILDLIKAEMRFAGSSSSSENVGTGKLPSEEDMIVRLWTLRQTLTAAGFPEARVEAVLKHILDIATIVSSSVKDSIWGLDEALEWLARECPAEELPLYEFKGKPIPRGIFDFAAYTPTDTPNASRPGTPKPQSLNSGKNKANTRGSKSASPSKKLVMTYDLDIEPEDLIPEYVSARAKHLQLSRSVRPTDSQDKTQLEIAQLEAKMKKIESDVLFDKFNADLKWKSEKILVERQLAAAKKEAQAAVEELKSKAEQSPEANADDSVNDEADRIAAEILAQEDEDSDTIAGLFASLPQNEVDPNTGKTQTVIAAADGTKLVLRDFGKWTGVGPRRVLEDSCRSRDPSVRITYTVVSEATFASRQSVDIWWTKAQELPHVLPNSDVEVAADATHFTFTMKSIAVSDTKQSEAYVSTVALFHIFNGNSKDEKVGLRLPPVWKDLWSEMAEAKKNYVDAQDREAVRSLRTMVRQRQDQELEDGVIAFRGRGAARNSPDSTQNGSLDRSRLNTAGVESLQRIWFDKARGEKFQSMLKFRMQLPMWQFRPQVLAAVDDNQVVIVCGETGWISAISLARRVSDELGENKGDLGTNRSLVGYSIRLEANTSRETRLVFATTGIVMRMLEGSNDLREVTHLILDEVHERSIDSDFLLIVLKRLLTKRKDLKVVLMSATVDAERFSAYLGGAPILNVPGRTFPVDVRYLEDAVELTGYRPSDSPEEKMVDLDDDVVEGEGNGPKSEISPSLSAYSPQTRSTLTQLDEYRIDFDLILQLMVCIASDESLAFYSKAILVFLPGIAEIRTLNDMLLGDPRFAKDWLVYPLHSSIATEDQESAFLVPPPGVRKIVLATNIAETGITIPDVTCVIDTGKHREMRFDEKKQLSRLIDTFISRANAKQRRGRAGRVQNGLCFHMFTKYRHDCIMSDQQTPEMLRLSLQDLAIRVKICKIGRIEETLSDALDAPSAKNIRRAIDALVDVRALTTAEELTPLGHQLARLPLDVFLGKLILLGTVFKCLDMSITVAAILSSKSPFSAPWGQRTQADNARMAFRRADSDLLTIYNAYLAWKRVCQVNSGGGKEFQFCRKNFLSQQTLANIEDLKGQLLVSLADSGFLSLTEEERRTLARLRFAQGRRRQQNFYEVPRRVNINSENDLISSSVIAWSFYPKLLVRDTPGTKGLRNIGNNQNISLHPSSVNRGFLDIKWLSYYHIMQSKTVYHAHETTAVEPFAIALLCGDVRCDMFSGAIVLDGNRGRFALPDWKTMLVLKVLRTRLRELLTRSFKQPGKLPTAQQEKWLEVWQKLFTQDQRDDGKSSGVSVAVTKA
ncbi:ATP dependent RNA helicase, putative [Metarhizium acridum CQMa 102]|uniref:ATP dependent RNA helicase, putative n=1 Tax=Metarhizium acridum (strain CQMa 102) TaxID=655827 RepID=E9DTF1_METAQ|nr:ATP dependent RNA helicase, putative [Metarhizium acridum CQMa 102]EFY93006.1 ATP dependent RNA helicase, putative [Metarhizium acridum CQMa 102]